MPAVPVLMVLYSTDSVEVRYSDNTRLQLSPCGSTLTHFDNPDSGTHPVYGGTKIQQRVRFVTSNHKQKVLQALDFRNRFAQRPYLCRELTPSTDITPLYTNIKEVKWSKQLDVSKVEALPDGGVRLMSNDDFASLVLSPHGRDFTVCYLSKISEELKKQKDKISPKVVRAKTEFNISSEKNSPAEVQERCSTPPNLDFTMLNNGSSPEFKIDPIYTQRVSTPTKHKTVSIRETPIVTPYGPTAVFQTQETDCSPITNLHELSSISKISSEGLNGTIETVDVTLIHGDNGLPTNKISVNPYGSLNSKNSSGTSQDSCNQNEEDSSVRYSYMWVTRHYSCSQCPIIWSHPLKLASQIMDNPNILDSSEPDKQTDKKSNNKVGVIKSCLPLPLPLTCPHQHLHRWTTGHGEEFQSGRLSTVMADGVIFRLVYLPSLTTVEMYPGDGSVIYSHGISGQFYQHLMFKLGKLEERSYSMKSLPPATPNSSYSIEKVVKRGSRFLTETLEEEKHTRREELPCWRHEESGPVEPISCEIFEECSVPGRGKFTAYTNGRIRIVFEDRTALDMVCDFSARLHGCLHQHGQTDGSPEKNVMPRVTGFDRLMGRESCRLLLPNGQYILVDITKPGIYDRYISAAKEWAKWVNSLPKDRGHFYQDMATAAVKPYCVETELKKINCFNYIIDNTVLNQNKMLDNSLVGSTNMARTNNPLVSAQPPTFTLPPTSRVIPSFNQMTIGGAGIQNSASQISGYSTQFTTYPSQYSSFVPRSSSGVCEMQQAGDSKDAEIFNGFNSVRQALLKTSKLINDIDHILDKSN